MMMTEIGLMNFLSPEDDVRADDHHDHQSSMAEIGNLQVLGPLVSADSHYVPVVVVVVAVAVAAAAC